MLFIKTFVNSSNKLGKLIISALVSEQNGYGDL